jgi:15-cis-phytoene synthase
VAKPAADSDWGFPNLATPPGSSAYYSVRFAPAGRRNDLAAVMAWRHQVRAVLTEVSDPGVARAKLQWWREELLRTQGGGPRHPLSRALAPVMARHRLPVQPFLTMAEGVQADLGGHQPADRAALEAGCEGDLGALFDLLARCDGVSDPASLASARALGGFCAQVYLIRDSGLFLRRGRAFLPVDRLAATGLSPGALALPEAAHRLPGLLAEAAAAALAYRDHGVGGQYLPATLRVRGRILAALLATLEAEGFDLAQRRIGLTPLHKLWLAWREARGRPANRDNGRLTTHH